MTAQQKSKIFSQALKIDREIEAFNELINNNKLVDKNVRDYGQFMQHDAQVLKDILLHGEEGEFL